MLALTGGICPVSRCAKSLMNGPCGGAKDGLCEINLAKEIIPEVPCAWLQIYDRLLALGELDRLMELCPPRIGPAGTPPAPGGCSDPISRREARPCQPNITSPFAPRPASAHGKTTVLDWNEGCMRCPRCVKEVCP